MLQISTRSCGVAQKLSTRRRQGDRSSSGDPYGNVLAGCRLLRQQTHGLGPVLDGAGRHSNRETEVARRLEPLRHPPPRIAIGQPAELWWVQLKKDGAREGVSRAALAERRIAAPATSSS